MAKKILLFNHGSTFGGSGVAFLNIIDAIKEEGYELIVYCAANKSDIADELEKKGISVIRAYDSPVSIMHYSGNEHSVMSFSFIYNIFKIFKDVKRVKKVILNEHPDLIMVNSMTLCWIGIISKMRHIPAICFHRETYAQGCFGIRTKIIKQILDHCYKRVAFISEYDLKETKLNKSLGEVIYDAVDVTRFNYINKPCSRMILKLEKDAFYVLYLGGASLLKGADTIISAIDKCDVEGIRLLFMGGDRLNTRAADRELSKIQKVYNRMKHPERIILAPNSEEIGLWYAASDMVVFPSQKAHQALPIYEAGIARRIIVISDFPNTKEFLTNKKNGLTVKAGDKVGWKNAIEFVYKNRQSKLFIDMIAQNEKLAMQYHDSRNIAPKIREIFSNGLKAKT